MKGTKPSPELVVMIVELGCCLRVGRSAAVISSTPTMLVMMMDREIETSVLTARRFSDLEMPALLIRTFSQETIGAEPRIALRIAGRGGQNFIPTSEATR